MLARTGALEPLIVRALCAYYSARHPAPVAASVLAELEGRRYVQLQAADGDVAAVYRIRRIHGPGGYDVLKRLVRPPYKLREALT